MEWRKPRLGSLDRIRAAVDAVKDAIPEGQDRGPFTSNRSMRRGASGQPASRKWAERMQIPKGKR